MNTRTALLDAAEHAARTRGFDAFSYADLSSAVGIRKASIHHHFPAKSDLALALIGRYREDFRSILAAIEKEHVTAAARLTAFLDTYRDALSGGDTVCLCVAFSAGRDSFQTPVLLELDGFHMDCLAWLDGVFRSANDDHSVAGIGDPEDEAKACLALVEGAQLMARAARNPKRFDEATTQFRRRLGGQR